MKMTDQQRAELKALAEIGWLLSAENTLSLLADLEEAEAGVRQGRKLLREEMQRAAERGESVLKLQAELAATKAKLEEVIGDTVAVKEGIDWQVAECRRLEKELAATRKQLSKVQNAYAEAAYADWSKHESALVVQLRQQLEEAREQRVSKEMQRAPCDIVPTCSRRFTAGGFYKYSDTPLVGEQALYDARTLQSAIEQAVAPYKREACAMACESVRDLHECHGNERTSRGADQCVEAIRARNEKREES